MLLERPWLLYEDEEVTRKHVICACCGQAIYYGNYRYEQDACYQVEDSIICEDCIQDYVKDKFFLRMEE